jgi:hypothetical protein
MTVGAISAVACTVAVISAGLNELKFFHKVSPNLVSMHEMVEWNTNFAKERGSVIGVDITDDEHMPKEDSETSAKGRAIIEHNQKHGITPWANLDESQVYSLLGYPPIGLSYRDHYGYAPVYFDKDRKGFIVDIGPNNRSRPYAKSLADISPQLQSIASRFHCKESRYLPGVFGLDPAYLHEGIIEPRTASLVDATR